ncbi:nucleotidyltransferase family protein [Geminocystis herdmanii]|uniref:nucleotidyltransferase family protein n=1 Tax=Geminocystis herdmanii TaxID=669359 RepID=UPI0003462CB2|nr:nucleotidyltransferase domain-containing protein [Geminocystis herdmanii]
MLLLSKTEIEKRLQISLNQIFDICQQWNIKEMALFGSVLRDDFNNESDVDFLISFQPNTPQGLLTISKLKSQLESLLNYPVDIAIKDSLNDNDNWIRSKEILTTAQTIYLLRN